MTERVSSSPPSAQSIIWPVDSIYFLSFRSTGSAFGSYWRMRSRRGGCDASPALYRGCVGAHQRGFRACYSGVGVIRVSNVHERRIAAPAARIGALLDTFASADDKFWPHENWPAVKFDLPLQVGATGGHGTGPYTVSSYTPSQHLRFEFSGGRQG